MQDFGEILGHEDIINYFKKVIKINKISHSYLMQGQEGIGKHALAKIFAKAVLCEEENKPCNKCISCLMMNTQNHPDYFEIIPKGASIGVEDIRNLLVEPMGIRPYKSKYKVFIIPNAEKMTTQAQNALLKTIEEPPAYGIIILITNKVSTMLSTIYSRCSQIRALPLPTDIIKNYIAREYNVQDWEASLYANFADGSLGKAKEIISDEGFWELRKRSIDYLIRLKNANLIELYDIAEELDKDRENFKQVIEFWLVWYRDILVYKSLQDEKYVFYQDFKDTILDRVEELSYNMISNHIDAIIKAKSQVEKNVNFMLLIENLLLQLKERNK